MKPTPPEIKVEEGTGDCKGRWFVHSVLNSWHRQPAYKKQESAEDVAEVLKSAYEQGWYDRERAFSKQFNLEQP